MTILRGLCVLSLSLLLVACGGFFTEEVAKREDLGAAAFHELKAVDLNGEPFDFASLAGRAVLVVNTASECGFTDQYEGLQGLHERFAAKGLSVVGVPSNDFGGQEPGSAADIASFCAENYGVGFTMLAKAGVKAGVDQSPIYAHLGAASGKLPGWNFGKYLVGRKGELLGYWDSRTKPLDAELVAAIEKALAAD